MCVCVLPSKFQPSYSHVYVHSLCVHICRGTAYVCVPLARAERYRQSEIPITLYVMIDNVE